MNRIFQKHNDFVNFFGDFVENLNQCTVFHFNRHSANDERYDLSEQKLNVVVLTYEFLRDLRGIANEHLD